jgi:peroxiredoxin
VAVGERLGVGTPVWSMESTFSALGVLVAGVLVLAAVTVLVWMNVQLLRQHGRILLRLAELETATGLRTVSARLRVGSRAPEFSLHDLETQARVSLERLRAAGKPVLLAFVDPYCSSCVALLPEVAVWQREHAERLTISLVSLGDLDANRTALAPYRIPNVLLQSGHEVADLYTVSGTPSAVLVRSNGLVASPLAEGLDAIRELVGNALVVQNQ